MLWKCFEATANPTFGLTVMGDSVSSPIPGANSRSLKQQLSDLAARIDGYRKSFDASKDSRAIFAYNYVLITQRLGKALDTAGFSDPAWIVRLAEAFAGKYIAAIDVPTRSPDLAPAWSGVLDTIRNKRTTVLEDLLFAITAHIVHDLPLALIEVGLKDVKERRDPS